MTERHALEIEINQKLTRDRRKKSFHVSQSRLRLVLVVDCQDFKMKIHHAAYFD